MIGAGGGAIAVAWNAGAAAIGGALTNDGGRIGGGGERFGGGAATGGAVTAGGGGGGGRFGGWFFASSAAGFPVPAGCFFAGGFPLPTVNRFRVRLVEGFIALTLPPAPPPHRFNTRRRYRIDRGGDVAPSPVTIPRRHASANVRKASAEWENKSCFGCSRSRIPAAAPPSLL